MRAWDISGRERENTGHTEESRTSSREARQTSDRRRGMAIAAHCDARDSRASMGSEDMILRSGGALIISALLTTEIAAQAPRVITIKASDAMKFDVTAITAKPGETLRVRVVGVGTIPKVAMAHNFVLLTSGTDAAKFAAAAATAPNHLPTAMKTSVIASTAMAGPGETVEVTFKAPAAPGKYQYICSFAGHFASGMSGWLVVK
jgi:azurin